MFGGSVPQSIACVSRNRDETENQLYVLFDPELTEFNLVGPLPQTPIAATLKSPHDHFQRRIIYSMAIPVYGFQQLCIQCLWFFLHLTHKDVLF